MAKKDPTTTPATGQVETPEEQGQSQKEREQEFGIDWQEIAVAGINGREVIGDLYLGSDIFPSSVHKIDLATNHAGEFAALVHLVDEAALVELLERTGVKMGDPVRFIGSEDPPAADKAPGAEEAPLLDRTGLKSPRAATGRFIPAADVRGAFETLSLEIAGLADCVNNLDDDVGGNLPFAAFKALQRLAAQSERDPSDFFPRSRPRLALSARWWT